MLQVIMVQGVGVVVNEGVSMKLKLGQVMRLITYNASNTVGHTTLSHLRHCLTRLIYNHYYCPRFWLG